MRNLYVPHVSECQGTDKSGRRWLGLQALAGVTFREPRIPVYSNVTAAPFPSAAAMPELLARQVLSPSQTSGRQP